MMRPRRIFLASLTVVSFIATAAGPRPAHAEPASASTHSERNSVPLMITGIGLSVLGLGAVGGGVAGMVAGARECDSQADRAVLSTSNLSLADQAGVRDAARTSCRDTSDAMAAGLGAVIGGSVLSAAGIAFTIAGAWKIDVRDRSPTTGAVLRVTPGFVGVAGTF